MRTAEQPAAGPKKTQPMLQAIRQRFTSGRPRVMPPDPVGAMFAIQMADAERNKIQEFIRERGNTEDFDVKVSVVTAIQDTDNFKSHTWPVRGDKGMDGILELADKLIKVKGIRFVGMLVAIHDRKTDNVLRYTRAFISSPMVNEWLAYASLRQQFGKEGTN